MRRVFLSILFLLAFVTYSHATIVTLGGGSSAISGHDYTPVTKTYSVTSSTTVSGQVVWTPASGKKITLLGVMFSSDAPSEFTIEKATTGYVTTTVATIIPRSYCITSGLVVVGNGLPVWRGETNDNLYLGTWRGGATIFPKHSVLLWGYETN